MSPRLKATTESQLTQTLARVDDLIKAGNSSQAREILLEVSQSKLKRPNLLPFAALARRAEVPDLALKVLSKIVIATKVLHPAPSADEIAEYAANLIKIGATTEAFSLLSALDAAACPNVHLYSAFGRIALWDYEKSIPHLEAFLAHPHSAAYLQLVARVNLASSLIHEHRYDSARKLIDALLAEAKTAGLTLLYGNLLELKAQNAIQTKQFSEAARALAEAEERLSATGNRFGLFVHKWKAILNLFKGGATAPHLAALRKVRDEATGFKHWETLRDCDRILALVTHDRGLALKLYFGTPFPSFRRKLLHDWGEALEIPPRYGWGKSAKRGKHLDLVTGELPGAKEPLKAGGLLHKLLQTLCSDFYRPLRLAGLFAALYPGEHFSSTTASLRIHQMTLRLRRWALANQLPLEVEEADGFYRMKIVGPLVIDLADPEATDPASPQLLKLRSHFVDGRWFVAREAAEVLQVSPRTALRLLKDLIAGGDVDVHGSGRQSKYRTVQKVTKL